MDQVGTSQSCSSEHSNSRQSERDSSPSSTQKVDEDSDSLVTESTTSKEMTDDTDSLMKSKDEAALHNQDNPVETKSDNSSVETKGEATLHKQDSPVETKSNSTPVESKDEATLHNSHDSPVETNSNNTSEGTILEGDGINESTLDSEKCDIVLKPNCDQENHVMSESRNDPDISDGKDENHLLHTPSEEGMTIASASDKEKDSSCPHSAVSTPALTSNEPKIKECINDGEAENHLLHTPSEEGMTIASASSEQQQTDSSCPHNAISTSSTPHPPPKECINGGKEEKHSLHTPSEKGMTIASATNEQQQTDSASVHNAVTTPPSPPITRSSDLEVGRIDFASAPKENLMRMISDLLDECDWLKREKQRLENEVSCLEADRSSLPYITQIEVLEKSLAQAQADSCSWEQKLQVAEQNYMTENVRIRTDLTTRLERVTKQYESANKDKEAMVIKYATSEREVIIAKKQKEALEKKMKDLERERESLVNKNKMLISERARICQTLDTKVQKNNWYQREVDRLKDELSGRDIKIKWTQAKLKSEMEAYKDCQEKLDHALTKITKHEEELRTIKEEAESIVQAAKQDENSRANVLDLQLKEEKARLIMERQVNEDRGSAYSKVVAELEELKHRHQELQEEAVSLRARLASRETEEEEMEKLFSCLRAEVTTARQEASDLTHQLSNSTHLQQQLTREKEHLERANEEVDRLQSTNNVLEDEVLACRQKEAELLAFTQKLSDKNVQIQSQFSALQSKTQLTEIEHEELKAEVEELKLQRAKLKGELAKETQKHNTELVSLTQQLTEKTEENKKLIVRTSDLENEVKVLNRKHNNAIKDMTREMQKLKRRMDVLQEHGSGSSSSNMGGNEGVPLGVCSGRSSQSVTPHDNLSQGSRASSNTSLNTMEYHNDVCPQTTEDQLPPLNDPLVTQQLLVDRIIRLQKSAAKRAEKMEFLEEHNNQLVGELKKKSRIIHHYIMKEEAGALVNSASDTSKVELMRYGGIMASVYGSAPRDDTMTLDLSLEINRKLQAVLEDTLLKNITLKENLNTLGDEIAKISQQKQAAMKK